MESVITKFKQFESKDEFDRDVEFDDVEVKEPKSEETPETSSEPESENEFDKSNEKEFENLHEAIKDIINQTAESPNAKQKTIATVKEEGIDKANLKGFTEENDIYEFYLEYQFEIDEKLSDIDFFNEPPSKYGITSLYDFVVQGTKIAVESIIIDMQSN